MSLVRFISAFLILCVFATSAITASLRVDAGTGQFVTICAGGQSVTVELDRSGAPIDPRHHCPDCISVVVLSAPQGNAVAVFVEAKLVAQSVRLSQTAIATPHASARAPPLTV